MRDKVNTLAKELYFYKKTSRDLKKQIRATEAGHPSSKESSGDNFVTDARMKGPARAAPEEMSEVLNDSLEQDM